MTKTGARPVRADACPDSIGDRVGSGSNRGDCTDQQPILKQHQSFTYTSGCPLTTPSGIMVGSYQMQLTGGKMLNVDIPGFSLDSPYAVRSIN